MKKIFSVLFLSFFILPLAAGLVSAQVCEQPVWCETELTEEERSGGFVPCGRSCDDPSTAICETDPCRLCHFFMMIDKYLDGLFLIVVPLLAALMIAIGGFMYVIAYSGGSEGGPKMLSQAKSLFKAVVIGILIIYGAWIMVNTFLMFIGVAEWTGLREGWWIVNCD